MVTPEIYINANAPTVAEGALLSAFWGEETLLAHVGRRVEHAAQYGVPREEYRAHIMRYIEPALESPKGLAALLRLNMWRSPGPQNIRAYLSRDWETDLSLPQVLTVIRRNT